MNEIPQTPSAIPPQKPGKGPNKLQQWWQSLDRKKQQQVLLIGGGGLIALVVLGTVAAALNSKEPTAPATPRPTPTPRVTPTPANRESMLDGVIVSNELATRHPLAIMVENSTVSRPQTGLTDASIIYEAIAEGGITRFMAVYGHTLPEKVGPVRSAREFVDFAEEFTPGTAYYAHVGGAPDALSKIKGDNVYDMDQFGIGTKAFQRFPKAGVATEHTMYTFPSKLYQIAKDRGYRTDSDFRVWKFKDDAAVDTRPENQSITIPFSSKTYEVKYTYDKTTNTYKRAMAGVDHKDAVSGKQIAARKGRQDVQVIGEGTAKIFRDGKVIEAKWKKPSSPGRTIYTDAASGEEIQFNRGQIWVEITKTGSNVTVE
jgi:hypothetical protein